MEPDPTSPGRGVPRELVVLGLVVAILIVSAIVLLVGNDGDSDVEAAGSDATSTSVTSATTSTTVPPSSSTLVFQAPPAQEPGVTVGPDEPSTTDTTADTTSTETTSANSATTTAPTATTVAPTTTTTTAPPSTTTTQPLGPRHNARPGPTIETVAGAHGRLTVALVEARDRWRNEGPSRGYTFRTQRVCFCPRTDNEVSVDASGRVTGQRTMNGDPEPDPPTIAEVFDLLEAAIRQDADSISASFDRDTGFPVQFSIDYEERMADEEEGRTIDWWAERLPASTTTTTRPTTTTSS